MLQKAAAVLRALATAEGGIGAQKLSMVCELQLHLEHFVEVRKKRRRPPRVKN